MCVDWRDIEDDEVEQVEVSHSLSFHVHQQNPLKQIIMMKLPLHPALRKSDCLPHQNLPTLKSTSLNTTTPFSPTTPITPEP